MTSIITVDDEDPFEKSRGSRPIKDKATAAWIIKDLFKNLTPLSVVLFWIVIQFLIYVLALSIVTMHLSIHLKNHCRGDIFGDLPTSPCNGCNNLITMKTTPKTRFQDLWRRWKHVKNYKQSNNGLLDQTKSYKTVQKYTPGQHQEQLINGFNLGFQNNFRKQFPRKILKDPTEIPREEQAINLKDSSESSREDQFLDTNLFSKLLLGTSYKGLKDFLSEEQNLNLKDSKGSKDFLKTYKDKKQLVDIKKYPYFSTQWQELVSKEQL